MGTYNSAVITNGGQSMIAQSLAGASIEFTTIKTSAYAYPAGTNLAALTNINGIKQSKDISGATVYNSRVIKISATVDNSGVTTAYAINTIGIYAKVGSAAEALFAVVTASAADTMPTFNSKPYSYIYEVNLTMQNAANVTVTVNSAGLVNVSDLNAARVSIRSEFQPQINTLKNTKAGALFENLSGSVVSFVADATFENLNGIRVYFAPVQSGEGNPSPSNVRPISGWNSINIWDKSTHDTELPPTVTVQLGQTYYSGVIDVTNGEITIDCVIKTGGWARTNLDSSRRCWFIGKTPNSAQIAADEISDKSMTNYFSIGSLESIRANNSGLALFGGSVLVAGYGSNPDALDAILPTLSVVYPLAEPVTYSIDPVTVPTIPGQENTVWSDAGDVSITYAVDIKTYIDRKISEINNA